MLGAGIPMLEALEILADQAESPGFAYCLDKVVEDIRSGSGVVHNSYLFDKPQKSVVRGPFMVMPRPAWFNDHKTNHKLGPALTRFNGKPSVRTLVPLLSQALRG